VFLLKIETDFNIGDVIYYIGDIEKYKVLIPCKVIKIIINISESEETINYITDKTLSMHGHNFLKEEEAKKRLLEILLKTMKEIS